MLPRDVYVQPDAPDPVLDDRTVLTLVRRHVRTAAAVTGVDESGGEARAYAIDGGIILKTQRPQQLRPRTSLEKEVFFLNQLAAFPEIPVPRVLGYGREGSIEYTCMTRIPGIASRTAGVEGEARARLLHEVGRVLRRIHTLPQAPFSEHPLFLGPRTSDDFRQRLTTGAADTLAALRANPALWHLDLSPDQLADKALSALPQSVDLVALHSNPGPEHIFVDPETLALTGVIDFGDAYIAHPAFDWRWPRYEDRLAILAGYQVDEPISAGFLTSWRAVLVLAEMAALANRPERRAAAREHLARLKDDI